ncbi:MAG: PilT/PilU family type 4a pilus ATPase [Deltaproteobacteria bacterium]|nr:PilT/PilU family type 4a pilus ATPase [Deltaproteobacteria bacterium]
MNFRDFLVIMAERNASDIYFTEDSPPMYRIEGIVQPIGEPVFTAADLESLAQSLMNERQWHEFHEQMEMNLALSSSGLGRFRVNAFRQRGSVGLVVHKINVEIATIDQLGLPAILKDIVMTKRGLVLVVGATGVGKSTSLAAMIDHRNSNAPGHIISIEDPIEFVHSHKQALVNQREVGFDTHSFQDALKNALRQTPDVILIGEIRDSDTMEAAITFADTGHLCLATLHSTNANQAFERIINFFPESRHAQTFLQLSLNMRAIISQRLVMGTQGLRLAAMEILLDTPRIKDLIKKGELDTIKEAMEQGAPEGCQTFDMALFDLYSAGRISLDQALSNADSLNNLRLKIKVSDTKDSAATKKTEAAGLRLEGTSRFNRM